MVYRKHFLVVLPVHARYQILDISANMQYGHELFMFWHLKVLLYVDYCQQIHKKPKLISSY